MAPADLPPPILVSLFDFFRSEGGEGSGGGEHGLRVAGVAEEGGEVGGKEGAFVDRHAEDEAQAEAGRC